MGTAFGGSSVFKLDSWRRMQAEYNIAIGHQCNSRSSDLCRHLSIKQATIVRCSAIGWCMLVVLELHDHHADCLPRL